MVSGIFINYLKNHHQNNHRGNLMKRVIAVIREEMFEEVKRALLAAGWTGMNMSTVQGRGRQLGTKESYRGSSYCIDFIQKTRVELIVNDEDLEDVISLIEESARTGEIGDGKIFEIGRAHV